MKYTLLTCVTFALAACTQEPGSNMSRKDRDTVYGAGALVASLDMCGHKIKPTYEAQMRRIVLEGITPYQQKYGLQTVNKVMLEGRKDAMAQVTGQSDPCDDRAARMMYGSEIMNNVMK